MLVLFKPTGWKTEMGDTFLIISQTKKKIYLIFVDSISNMHWNSARWHLMLLKDTNPTQYKPALYCV